MGNAVSRLCCCCCRPNTAVPQVRFSDCSNDRTEEPADIEDEDEETKTKCSPSKLQHHKYDAKSLEAMLDERMQQVETKVEIGIESVKQLCNQSLRSDIAIITDRLQELEIRQQVDANSMETILEDKLQKIGNDIETLQQMSTPSMGSDITVLTDRLQKLENRKQDYDKSLETMLKDRLQQVETTVKKEIESKKQLCTPSLGSDIEILAGRLQELENRQQDDVKSMEAIMEDKMQNVETTVKDLATSQQDINSLADTVQSLETMVQDLHTKVERLNHSKYVNWVKTSLSLLYLKQGITKFSDEKAGELHKAVLARVKVVIQNAATTMCTKCTYGNIGKTSLKMNCNSNICNEWLKEILPYHSRPTKIAWANSNPQRWPSDVWELAKLFQPHGCKKHTRAEDSDCTGLLTLMQDCKFIRKFLKNDTILQEIKEVRNACMHSNDLLINDADMRNGLNLMISLLEEKDLKKRQECIDAKREIVKLRDNVLDLSLKKELESKALIQKMTEVRNDMDRLVIEQQHLKSAQDEMKNRQENTEEECNQMQDRMKDFEKSVTEMKRSIAPLEKIADLNIDSKVTDLTKRLKEMENRNKECMEDIGNSTPKSLTEEPWREVQYPFSPQYENQLIKEMEHQITSDRVKRANLLLLVPSVVETCSFVNSVIDIREGQTSYVPLPGDDTFAPRPRILKNVCLIVGEYVERGEVDVNPDDFAYMVNGHVDWKYLICDPISVDDRCFISEPKERDKMHCVIYVMNAKELDKNTTRMKTINQMRDILNGLGVPQVMVLTDIEISNVYRSVKVKDMVIKASKMFKMPPDLIFPVQNYRYGEKIDYKRNIPILLALRRGISLADDFLKKQEGLS